MDNDGLDIILDKAIKLNPNETISYFNMARALVDLGKKKEAIPFLEVSLKINPNNIKSHRLMVDVKEYKSADDSHIHDMEKLVNDPNIPIIAKGQLLLAVGKAYEIIKDYDRAFDCYKTGNDCLLTEYNFDYEFYYNLYNDRKKAFTKEFLEKHKNAGIPGYSPIFIVGMPRSGTSLLEQILSSHPDVYGAGELTFLQEYSPDSGLIPEDNKKETSYSSIINKMDDVDIRKTAEFYKGELDKLPTDSKHIVDKNNFNFMYIPLIKVMFPDAKIIHSKRDPMDSCFSMYKFMFYSKGLHFTNSFDSVAAYYNLYDDLMSYFHELTPDFIMDIQYEDLIDDFEEITKKMVSFCGLPWDDRCLHFYETERTVQTPSSLQVKSPIYKSSVGAWKKFEKHLGPLKQALENKTSTTNDALVEDALITASSLSE
jgi:tetratricopeptide (TPR) repeat protein